LRYVKRPLHDVAALMGGRRPKWRARCVLAGKPLRGRQTLDHVGLW
jgi:hypothetical protein